MIAQRLYNTVFQTNGSAADIRCHGRADGAAGDYFAVLGIHLTAEGDINTPIGGFAIGVQQYVVQRDMTVGSMGKHIVSANGMGNNLGI